MSRSRSRTALVFFAFGLLPNLFCQELPAPDAVDSAVYQAFFQAAVAHKTAITGTTSVSVNGQAAELTSISIQDAIGITAAQSQSIIQFAALCEGDVNTLDASSHAVVFESRLQAAQDDKPSDDIDAKLKAIEAKRVPIILGYVQQIKASLGAEAFKKVDDYIHAHASAGSFFPATGAPQKKL